MTVTATQRNTIRRMMKAGKTDEDIARQTGLHALTIRFHRASAAGLTADNFGSIRRMERD